MYNGGGVWEVKGEGHWRVKGRVRDGYRGSQRRTSRERVKEKRQGEEGLI